MEIPFQVTKVNCWLFSFSASIHSSSKQKLIVCWENFCHFITEEFLTLYLLVEKYCLLIENLKNRRIKYDSGLCDTFTAYYWFLWNLVQDIQTVAELQLPEIMVIFDTKERCTNTRVLEQGRHSLWQILQNSWGTFIC